MGHPIEAEEIHSHCCEYYSTICIAVFYFFTEKINGAFEIESIS